MLVCQSAFQNGNIINTINQETLNYPLYVYKHNLFYGGILWDKNNKCLTLWYDSLRLYKYVKIYSSSIYCFQSNPSEIDILLSNGTWVSGLKIPQLQSAECDFINLKFPKSIIVNQSQDTYIVNLPSLTMSVADKYLLKNHIFVDQEALLCQHPLTIAYRKIDDELYIGYWDIITQNFVGSLHRYGRNHLDI